MHKSSDLESPMQAFEAGQRLTFLVGVQDGGLKNVVLSGLPEDKS